MTLTHDELVALRNQASATVRAVNELLELRELVAELKRELDISRISNAGLRAELANVKRQ